MYTFFSEKIVKFFVKEQENKKKGFIKKIKDKAGEITIGVLRKTLSDSFMDDLMEMATAFQSLFGAFRQRGEVVEQLLRAQDTNFVIVTGPDPLRVNEATDYIHALDKLRVNPDLWIVNRVHESPSENVVFKYDDVAGWLSSVDLDNQSQNAEKDIKTLCDDLNQAARLAFDLKQRDDRGLQTIERLLGTGALVKVEAFTEEVEDGQAVEQFIRALRAHAQGLTVTCCHAEVIAGLHWFKVSERNSFVK